MFKSRCKNVRSCEKTCTHCCAPSLQRMQNYMADVFPQASLPPGSTSEVNDLLKKANVRLRFPDVNYRTVGKTLELDPHKTYLMDGLFKLYRVFHQYEEVIRSELVISKRCVRLSVGENNLTSKLMCGPS